jgi:hypothetical protein
LTLHQVQIVGQSSIGASRRMLLGPQPHVIFSHFQLSVLDEME